MQPSLFQYSAPILIYLPGRLKSWSERQQNFSSMLLLVPKVIVGKQHRVPTSAHPSDLMGHRAESAAGNCPVQGVDLAGMSATEEI